MNNGSETSTHFSEPIPVEYECLGENIHSVCYYPKEVGEYHVAVTWKGNHVTGSPFAVKVDKKVTFPEKDDVKTEEQDNKDEVWKLRDDKGITEFKICGTGLNELVYRCKEKLILTLELV